MKKIISVLMVMLLFRMVGMPTVTSAQNPPVTFGIRFDKDAYGVEDTAVATVYVKGLTASASLGGLGTNLSFSAEDLTYTSGQFAQAITDAAPAEMEIGCKALTGKNIIYLFFVDAEGVSVNALKGGDDTDAEVEIAKLYFTVQNPADSTASLGFEEASVDGALPYKTDIFDSALLSFPYSFSAPAAAQIEDLVFLPGPATQTGGTVTASPVISTTGSVLFAAKLSDAVSGRLLAAPVFAFPAVGKKTTLNVSFAYDGAAENAKVTYYFWGTGAALMQPLRDPVPVPVSGL